VQFNEVDREAFENNTVSLFGTLPGVTMGMYHEIQTELQKIRSQAGEAL
jgi:hypothetical protein